MTDFTKKRVFLAVTLAVATLSSAFGKPGDIDPSFSGPTGDSMVQDVGGDLWLADDETIRQVSLDGEVKCLVKLAGTRFVRLVAHPKGGVYVNSRQVIKSVSLPGSDRLVEINPPSLLIRLNADGSLDEKFRPEFGSGRLYCRTVGESLLVDWDRADSRENTVRIVDEHGQSHLTKGWKSIHHFAESTEGHAYAWGEYDTGGGNCERVVARLRLEGRFGVVLKIKKTTADNRRVQGSVLLDDGRLLVAYSDRFVCMDSDFEEEVVWQREGRGRINEGIHFAKRPDGRVMFIADEMSMGDLSVGDDSYCLFGRLTKEGRIDATFPVSVICSRSSRIAVTDEWTYFCGKQVLGEGPLMLARIDSGDIDPDAPADSEALSQSSGERIVRNEERLAYRQVSPITRADGFDDLIVVDPSPMKGLTRLINPRAVGKPWETRKVSAGIPSGNDRAIATGLINGDAVQDLVELKGHWTSRKLYWYRGNEQGKLDYVGELKVGAPNGIWEMRVADFDGDGDSDLLVQLDRRLDHLVWLENENRDASQSWPARLISKPDKGRSDGRGRPHFGGAILIDDDGPRYSLYVEDLDHDGDVDLAYVSEDSGKTRLWLENDGTGRFQVHEQRHYKEPQKQFPKVLAARQAPGLRYKNRWKGRVLAMANINGDAKADRVIVFPDPFADDDDGDGSLAHLRGLRWERGDIEAEEKVEGGGGE